MEVLTSFIKNFFVLMLLLSVVSYLVPKESYRRYIQFFIGIFMAVILLKPAVEWMFSGDTGVVYENLDSVTKQLEQIEFKEENGEDIFGIFDMDSETE